ncbi:hypothetical protein LTR10_015897 [Elasticomyces elasticus]|nr:hypothetical protein LTR10_015897 [Elasticomyces elasticus]
MRTMQPPTLWCIFLFSIIFATIVQTRDVAPEITPHLDNSTLPPTVERYGKGLTFEQARDAGSCHLDRLESGNIEQSIFNDQSMLNDNGWTAGDGKNLAPLNLDDVYNSLGISTDEHDNFLYDGNWTQDKTGETQQAYGNTEPGFEFGATKAQYRNRLNSKDGMLLCQYNYGPAFTIDMEGGHGPTPPLWRFSDVLWLQWEAAAAAAEQSVSNIKYFLRNGVKDWDSLAVVDAIRQRGYPLKGWANCDTFEMQDDDPDKQDIARALLGTPNGNGIVWFLLQHKQQTGKRFTVSRVTLWEGALDATMLLFDVEEVSS